MDEFERLAEFIRLEVSAGRDRRVLSLSGGQTSVVLIVEVSTHPFSTVRTH